MNKNTSSRVAALCVLLLAAFDTTHADAQNAQTVPALINYQGKLVSSNGLPVSTGDYQLRFRIYDAVTDGNLIWGPQIFNGQTGAGYGPLVSVVQGWFNVILGPADTNGVSIANGFAGTNRFMEIQLSNNAPFSPRQQVLSAPFALRAASSALADLAAIASTVPDSSITSAKIAFGAVGSSQLGGGVIQSGNIASAAVGSSQIAAGAVGSNHIATGAVGVSQIAPGILGFVPHNIAVFTNSGTWTKPANVSSVYVKVWGGGGGGSGASSSSGSYTGSTGGGGGGYSEGFVTVTGDTQVTVGGGGAGGSNRNYPAIPGNGITGGNSSFAASGWAVVANGGGGGTWSSDATQSGSGGGASGGQINIFGGAGGAGSASGSSLERQGGAGGGSFGFFPAYHLLAAAPYACGGCGGDGLGSGQGGGPGLVIVYY